MKLSRRLTVLSFAFFSLGLAAMQGHAAEPSTSQSAVIAQQMQRYEGHGPGAALLVIKDSQAIVSRGFGLANLEDNIPVTPQSNFRLASITKQFTAASILLLAEDGKLGLDDPVKHWLPSLPKAADTITLRQLLSHTSGLIDYEDVMPADFSGQLHDSDVLQILEGQDRTYFAPGTSYRYSNSGYALLALIVGKASGQDFASFLRQRIFLPLGMQHTVALEEGRSSVVNRAYGYTETDGRWQRTDQSSTSAVLGDGGIYSSLEDLARWDAALYDQRLLEADSLKLAFSPATRTDEPHVPYYGFGWRIDGDTLWHSGESIGFRNVILRFPKERLTVIVLSNRNDPEPYATANAIAEAFRQH